MVLDGMRAQGLTQYRLSLAAGISEKHLSQLLRGRTAGSLDVWDRLLKAASGRVDFRRRES